MKYLPIQNQTTRACPSCRQSLIISRPMKFSNKTKNQQLLVSLISFVFISLPLLKQLFFENLTYIDAITNTLILLILSAILLIFAKRVYKFESTHHRKCYCHHCKKEWIYN